MRYVVFQLHHLLLRLAQAAFELRLAPQHTSAYVSIRQHTSAYVITCS
jgi:hypothetical protein